MNYSQAVEIMQVAARDYKQARATVRELSDALRVAEQAEASAWVQLSATISAVENAEA